MAFARWHSLCSFTGLGRNVDQADRDALCGALLGYLQEHPNAMDTLTGIADWWLPRYRVQVGVEQVAEALRTLEASGLVERVGDESRPLFRLRKPDTD